MHPNSPRFYWDMADVYEQRKMHPEAFAARQQALSLAKDPRVTVLAEAYRHSGYKGYLEEQADYELTHNPPYAAHIYSLLNDEPRAMAVLEAESNKRNMSILFTRTAPEFDSIRSSSRFRELVRRIGFPQTSSDKN